MNCSPFVHLFAQKYTASLQNKFALFEKKKSFKNLDKISLIKTKIILFRDNASTI